MFPCPRSRSLSHRIAAILMAVAILLAGQGIHMPKAQAGTDGGGPYLVSGHTSDEPVLNMGGGMLPSEHGRQSQRDCAGVECGSCAATATSSTFGSPFLHDLPSGHAVINSAVRPPERLFRPPIRLS